MSTQPPPIAEINTVSGADQVMSDPGQKICPIFTAARFAIPPKEKSALFTAGGNKQPDDNGGVLAAPCIGMACMFFKAIYAAGPGGKPVMVDGDCCIPLAAQNLNQLVGILAQVGQHIVKGG